MCPNEGVYGATPPELFLGMLWRFPCSVVLPTLEGTEQLESSDGMGGSEEKSFPRTCLEVVVVGGRKSSWILTAPVCCQRLRVVCALLSEELP